MKMKKSLSPTQFQQAVCRLELSQQTLEIAWGVLVEGKPQKHFAVERQLTKGAVSQAVNRVWRSHMDNNVPEGFVKIQSVILKKRHAYQVKKWAEEAQKTLELNQ